MSKTIEKSPAYNSRDKWKMFKNFLHNELGISKEDIREWILAAVKDEVERLLSTDRGKVLLTECNKAIQKEIRSYLIGSWGSGPTDLFKKAVADAITQRINVRVAVSEPEENTKGKE